VRKIWETSEKLVYILMFLSPGTACPSPYLSQTKCAAQWN
jgi:hypothetical protein